MPSKTPSPTIVATPAKEKESHTSPVGVRLARSNTLTGELSHRLGGAILGEFDLNSPRNDMLNKTGKADTPESFSALASSDSGVKVPPWSAPRLRRAPVPGTPGWFGAPTGETVPKGARPRPRVCEPAAYKAVDFPAFHDSGPMR